MKILIGRKSKSKFKPKMKAENSFETPIFSSEKEKKRGRGRGTRPTS